MEEPVPGRLYVNRQGSIYRVWAIAQGNLDGGNSYVAYGVPGSAPGFAFEAEEALSQMPVSVWMEGSKWLVQPTVTRGDRPVTSIHPIGWITDLRTFWHYFQFTEYQEQ